MPLLRVHIGSPGGVVSTGSSDGPTAPAPALPVVQGTLRQAAEAARAKLVQEGKVPSDAELAQQAAAQGAATYATAQAELQAEADSIDAAILELVKTFPQIKLANPPSSWADDDARLAGLTRNERLLLDWAPSLDHDSPTGSTRFAVGSLLGGDPVAQRRAFAEALRLTKMSATGGTFRWSLGADPLTFGFAHELQTGRLNQPGPSVGDVLKLAAGTALLAIPGAGLAGAKIIEGVAVGKVTGDAEAARQAQTATAQRDAQERSQQEAAQTAATLPSSGGSVLPLALAALAFFL